MGEPMLELVNVTAGYGRSMVLYDVSLTVPLGGGVALMGHNGAGKTTLLRVAVGLLPVRSGKVLLDGKDVTKLRPHARVRSGLGYVPQGQLCFPQMTTLENLQLVTSVKSDIDEVLDTFPALKELLPRRAGLLSGGQRQQLSIARTLLTKPRMLILDEPTEGIQPDPARRPLGPPGRAARRLRAAGHRRVLRAGIGPGDRGRRRWGRLGGCRPRRDGRVRGTGNLICRYRGAATAGRLATAWPALRGPSAGCAMRRW
jgi:urea transport system ATP-binding protein